MRGAIVATLILLSTGHVEGVGRDHWRSDHVHLEGGHQQGGGDGHQHPGLGENIDLRARARAAHRSGKCELLFSQTPRRQLSATRKTDSFRLLIEFAIAVD